MSSNKISHRLFEMSERTTEIESEQRPPRNPCIVHDPMDFHGGGERYAVELARALDAPLFTYQQQVDFDGVEISTFGNPSWFDRMLTSSPLSGLVHSIEYENFEVPDEFDVVITTGGASKSLIHNPRQRRIHLLHSPSRWLFDLGHNRYDDSIGPIRWVKKAYQSYMRVHEQSAVSRIDDFVVNSEVIGRRLETYHRRQATEVIYPPINTSEYYHEPGEGFLLYLGRLEEHKMVEEIVRQLTGTEYQLKIAGTGSKIDEIRQIAGENVELLGYVTEAEKLALLARCDALIFNSLHEDFGIVPVEALASGKPVVGVDEGFTSYQIEDGENGILYERSQDAIYRAVERMYEEEWDHEQIQETAQRYDVETFTNSWQNLLTQND